MGNSLSCFKPAQIQTPRDEKYTDEGNDTHFNDTEAANKYKVPPSSSKTRVRALYKFEAINKGDLTFMKGDIMEIDDETLTDDVDWISAVHLNTKKRGYVPSNYVAIADSTPQTSEWWFPFDKKEANKILLQPGNSRGIFLVRQASDETSYVLTVRDVDVKTGDPCVKHYRLHAMDNNKGYYINAKKTFPTISDLIKFYKEHASGICCKLTKPCKHTPAIVPFRQLEIDRDKVRLVKELGTGCFGDVWEGMYLQVVNVAVKTLKSGTMTCEAFLNEAKIMHKLRHQKLVQILAVVSSEEPFYIITELMVNGALLDYLHSETGRSLELPTLIDMNSQIADGMAYLEKVKFIHRDLRAANILVGQNYEVKVADFGLARMLEEDETYISNPRAKFPLKWSAPEAAIGRKFSVKSDVWSFGVLMYEIITHGKAPYPGMSNMAAVAKIENGYRMEKPTNKHFTVPDSYYDMMLKCWNKKPEQRPKFASLHEFFSSTEPDYDETAME